MIFIYIYSFLIGSLLTSYLVLFVSRFGISQSIVGRSHCDSCGRKLRIIDVIPIVGYFINFGHCKNCGAKIPLIYPIFELIGGLVFMLIHSTHQYDYLVKIEISFIFLVLFTESYSDIVKRIVIDRVWLIGFVALLVTSIIRGSVLNHLFSSAVMFLGLLTLSYLMDKLSKKDSLGGGDIKLYLFIGMVLELPLAFLSLFFASVFGLLYAMIKKNKSDPYIPLVPFISLGVFVAYFWGQDLINWYLSLLGM